MHLSTNQHCNQEGSRLFLFMHSILDSFNMWQVRAATSQCSIVTYAFNTSWVPGKIAQRSTLALARTWPCSNKFYAQFHSYLCPAVTSEFFTRRATAFSIMVSISLWFSSVNCLVLVTARCRVTSALSLILQEMTMCQIWLLEYWVHFWVLKLQKICPYPATTFSFVMK